MVDVETIRKLENQLAEKVREVENHKRRHSESIDQVKLLQEEVEKERRKSLADESKIKKLEGMIREKIEENNKTKE